MMSNDIHVTKINEVYVRVFCDISVITELSEYFKFRVPGYQFVPAYKNKTWNGYIYLFNRADQTLYSGLVPYIEKFCENRCYSLTIDDNVFECCDDNISIEKIDSFIKSLNLPFEIREYQKTSFIHAIKEGRCLLLSPTASGKSAIIYMISRWYNLKTLIIVPTISLVTQMEDDFLKYSINNSFDSDKDCHTIFSGKSKDSSSQIIISTWQSIYKMSKNWFEQFDVIIGDEAHLYKSSCIKELLCKTITTKYKFGTTGTLDGSKTNKLVLEGLFGKVHTVVTTKQLIDKSFLAKLKIQCILLKYTDDDTKIVKSLKYHDEIKFLINHKKRTNFICNLANTLSNNTLLLFQYVESHGKVIYEQLLKKNINNKQLFYVYGGTDADTREEIRQITEKEKNAIIVASVGVFSTGVNIRNLDNIIFASPSKSRIRTLQSIGRILRVGDNTDTATVYDIVDDLTCGKKKNFALKHFFERVHIYNNEKFNYKVHTINFEKEKSKLSIKLK